MKWPAALVVLLLAGCGGSRPVEHRAHAGSAGDCTAAAPGFRTCFGLGRKPATIERRHGSGWSLLTGPLQPTDPTSQWGPKVWPSPDRQTLLAEWTFPCDSAVAVFVSLNGGKARVVTGQKDWRKAPISYPLGWTRGGKARVRMGGTGPIRLIDPRAVERTRARFGGC